MSTLEPENIGELIADCAAIPAALTEAGVAEAAGPHAPWAVDERCAAQVEGMESYI
ncbi:MULTISPECIES: hypothetical protein [Actinokineospora]|uniref:Uncharacterized protein n=1 Tax=Actinokineospora fastidiosa TaxID=1816 RepID=A0A918GJ85_9PSEU|nr:MULTISPECIES: hypothetical protein [Actinokineospora]UVS77835.1 hypothetical protein Actkin_01558 [Actinokineospora sp. UTMC 2448]GGS40676.1 hypothetical protein GCM10010171_38990 [Actinokineospora fastidiosa]